MPESAPAPAPEKPPVVPPPAEPAPAPVQTIAESKPAETETAAPADWPADWRQKIAGEDKNYLKQLERYGSPIDYANKARALEQKLSSGEYKKATPLAKDATDEQRAAWRKDMGLPEKAETFIEKAALPDGIVLGEADKPLATSFAAIAFDKGWSQENYNDALAWYYANKQQTENSRMEADGTFKQGAEDALRSEWGNDYRRNLNALGNLRDQMPEGLATKVLAARDPEGRLLGDNPSFLKWMLGLALELNPASTLVPGGGAAGKGIEGRLAEIRKFASENPDKYDQDKTLQKEHQDLLAAQAKMKARAA